jgi:hypothetical protein
MRFFGANFSLGLLLLVPGSGICQPSQTELHSIRLLADAAGRQARDRFEIDSIDYGSFIWAQVDSATLARLTRLGAQVTEVGVAGQVRLPTHRFDPLNDGEPQLPSRLSARSAGPRLQLLQLVGPLHPAWLPLFESNRVQLLQYLPHYTYLIWTDGEPGSAEPTALDAITRWRGEYHPAYRISPTLARLIEERGRQRVHIRVFGRYAAETCKALAAALS